ncbi:hypothetical protein HY949_04330 [Candidatus Gottesmanbacteria bacterium]|nr:hypothetical protein [Candidatus Gottesmanbacteria bacterium]
MAAADVFGFIRRIHTDKAEIRLVFRLSAAFLILFVLYLIVAYFVIRTLSYQDIQSYLRDAAGKVSGDFDYNGGTWNTNNYLSDTTTPSESPLYIFSLDGFVIDRMNVIRGFLDTSNAAYASSFPEPKTIISPVGEQWRVFSYPILRDGNERGVILLGYFEPAGRPQQELDELLLTTAKMLDRQISFPNGVMDATAIVDKEFEHNISFEIIDIFNISHKSVGGPPAYIDKSYLQDILRRKDFWTVAEDRSEMNYLVYARPIIAQGSAVGIVVMGKALDQLDQTLGNLLAISAVTGALLVFMFSGFTIYLYRHDIRGIIKERLAALSAPRCIEVKQIAFEPRLHTITVNGVQSIPIPPDSYQYDICAVLFKHPRKAYDVFDLSDALGEGDDGKNMKRRIYDAVEAINARIIDLVGAKLIVYQDKKYFINPSFTSKMT